MAGTPAASRGLGCVTYRVEQLCFLARREPTVRKSRNLERSWSFLSLEYDFSSSTADSSNNERSVLFSPLFYSLTCHLSSHHWLIGFPYPPTIGFSSNLKMPHVHMGPTLELKLTDSAPDTWHIVNHSKCAKCSALRSLPRKTCKF